MTINKEQAVSDAVIEAGLKAWDRMNAAMVARNASDEPEDMPDHDEGDIVREIYLAMKAASHPLEQQQAVSGDVVERVAVALSSKLWAVANSRDHSDCGGWEELPRWVQDKYREAAIAALTASGMGRMREALQAIADFQPQTKRSPSPYEQIAVFAKRTARTALQGEGR